MILGGQTLSERGLEEPEHFHRHAVESGNSIMLCVLTQPDCTAQRVALSRVPGFGAPCSDL